MSRGRKGCSSRPLYLFLMLSVCHYSHRSLSDLTHWNPVKALCQQPGQTPGKAKGGGLWGRSGELTGERWAKTLLLLLALLFFYYFYFLWCPHCCLLLQPPLASMNNEKESSIELFPCFAAWTHTSVSKLFEQTSNHQVFLFFDFCPPFQLALSCIPNTSVLGESSAMDLDVWAVIACGRKLGFLEKFQVEFGLTQTELNAKLWVLEAKITDTMQMWLSLKHLFKLSTHQMLESLPIISPRAPRFPASGQDSVHHLRPLFDHFFLPPALHMPCAIHARSTTGPMASVDIGSNCFCFAFASMPISDQTDLFSCLIPQFHLDNP